MKELSQLEQAVGQLIIGKLPGLDIDEEGKSVLSSGIMGGITLFKENASNLEQLCKLIAAVYKFSPAPPIIAVDQEGGAVQRFDHLLTPLPSAMALAAIDDLGCLKTISDLSAKQLSLLGVNCLLAPVLDILSNPLNPVIGTRAYSSDPSKVSEYGLTVNQAISTAGLLAVGKHFPGHGATLEDSHTHLAINKSDARLLWQRELVPFRACINQLAAILTAHIWLPSIDEDTLPASLSERVTTGLLREYLGFDGLIMTDDLLMKAIADRWGVPEAAVMAILAGADQVLVCGSFNEVRSTHKALLEAVKSGRITQDRLHQSLARIKKGMAQMKPAIPLNQKSKSSTKAGTTSKQQVQEQLNRLQESISAGQSIALEASRAAISVLRGKPLTAVEGQWIVVAPDHPRYKLNLASSLKKAVNNTVTIEDKRYSLNPSEQEIQSIVDICSNRNCIFLTYKTLSNKGQVSLGRALSANCRQCLNVATDIPYDLIGLPTWDNCLATFDPSDLAMEALSAVLSGQIEPSGTCPVSLQIEM